MGHLQRGSETMVPKIKSWWGKGAKPEPKTMDIYEKQEKKMNDDMLWKKTEWSSMER